MGKAKYEREFIICEHSLNLLTFFHLLTVNIRLQALAETSCLDYTRPKSGILDILLIIRATLVPFRTLGVKLIFSRRLKHL